MATTPYNNQQKRLNPLWEGRILLLSVGLALTFLLSLLVVFPPLLLQQAELRLYDLMRSGRISPPSTDAPVLVGIDDESLAAYGQWPWPRYRLAWLVERLHELGARVVALDILMPEADRTSPEIIISERRRDRETAPAIYSDTADDSNSMRLASAMARGETVLGYYFNFAADNASFSPALPESAIPHSPAIPSGMILLKGAGSDTDWPKPAGMIRGIPELTRAARAEGFTNALHDRDGALRRVPLLLSYKGREYPSLAMAALLVTSQDRRLHLVRHGQESSLIWRERIIPLDREGNLLLDFRDEKRGFTYYSSRAVIAGDIGKEPLAGKIVLVGPWAKGLGDQHLVPSGHSLSGLAIHATIIDNILSGTFMSRPGWARGAELSAVVLLGILGSWLLSSPGFMLSLATVITGTVGCYWGARELLVHHGLYVSPLLPLATPIVIMTFLSLLKYGIEARKLRLRTLDLIDAQDTIIISMSSLTEARDKETGGHILRTRRYVEILARQLAAMPKHSYLDETSIVLLAKSAPLHDIGKVGIPDIILHKPGNLTDEEYTIMKSHTLIGVDALSRTIGGTGHPEHHDFLHYARQMIESHHERWDGSGYPHGLRGEEIPLAGRLMSLADTYDAMVSRRVYKEGLSHEKARENILGNSGKMFDPDVVSAFMASNEEFLRISQEYADYTDPEEH